MCVALCVPALNHGGGYISRGANVNSGAAGCSIDERESLRPFGITWNLFASGATEWRPVPWNAMVCTDFFQRNMDRWSSILP